MQSQTFCTLTSLRAFRAPVRRHEGRPHLCRVSAAASQPQLSPEVADLLQCSAPAAPGGAAPATAAAAAQDLGALQDLVPDLLAGCEPRAAPLRVALLLSGGVDSSLALHLVRAAGHEVTAFYLQIWFQEDFRNFWGACPWEEDLEYCQQACRQLGVPLEVVPLTDAYWDRVVVHTISEIRSGRTPNPDVLCNSRVKFGAFYEYLDSQAARFDRVASGHYARLERPPVSAGTEAAARTGPPPVRLALTPDAVKDQTYFLAHLTPAQLSRALFPLGGLTKAEVRQLAEAAGVPASGRADSQGICFLGKVKFAEFVREHLGEWPGPIVEAETNEVLGYHKGFWFHTVGQRKGIQLSGGPWYVTLKDPRTNTVYVSRQYYEQDKLRNSFTCCSFSWLSDLRPHQDRELLCKVRHGPHFYRCSLVFEQGGAVGRVRLDGNDQGLAAGQSAVFYQDGYCLGSAVIT